MQILLGRIGMRGRYADLSSNLSTYEAQYVALADGLGLPLITSDARNRQKRRGTL
ncbi:hypothetical protein ABZ370_42965 [Streptomyces sp. NPDC005962]|uniref:hypothetical protein n=1 Tax=Streptomyces sp. NPDC005962 TaxID=3154466 RepID=UPI0033E7C774